MKKEIKKSKFSCVREGLTIRGLEYRGEGKSLPIAIVSHEFMSNRLFVKRYAKQLAKQGYAAFCFDFCGGCVALGKSDGKTTQMSVLTEVKDLLAVIEYAKGLSYTNPSKILLMGCSQGGLVSALTASKLKNEIEKLVLFYPALCIPDDARSGKMMLAKFDPKNPPELLRCGPMKLGKIYVQDVINMDAFEQIAGYNGEVLIVHGSKDKIVNLDYARRAEKTYKENGVCKSVSCHVIEGCRHMFCRKHDKIAKAYLNDFARLDE